MEHVGNDSIAVRQRTFLDVEENSKLDIRSYHTMGIVSSRINVNGVLISKSPIGNSLPSTIPGKVFLGSKSSVLINTISPGLLFLDELAIERGAVFDFINSSGGEVVQNSNDLNMVIDCYYLALWDLGMQNEEFSSMSFEDASLKLSGKSASIIQESNLNRFNLVYSKNGLEDYSRIASLDIEELTRIVIVKHQDETGNELAPQVLINGKLGTNYQTYEKSIYGYN